MAGTQSLSFVLRIPLKTIKQSRCSAKRASLIFIIIVIHTLPCIIYKRCGCHELNYLLQCGIIAIVLEKVPFHLFCTFFGLLQEITNLHRLEMLMINVHYIVPIKLSSSSFQ
jgi:hypothetical protein